ncbi:MAG: hypothetical protein HY094_02285 [Candidatus Melainabacteria bacterium]|nr:hypothetical protein [Candidatus Melainabacteria bacterium]
MFIEEQKYRAEIFKIGGFSLMAPFGKLILGIPDFRLTNLSLQLLVFVIVVIASFYVGIILILKGFEALGEMKQK